MKGLYQIVQVSNKTLQIPQAVLKTSVFSQWATSGKPEMDAAVQSQRFQNSVSGKLYSSLCRTCVVVVEEMPVLHKPQVDAQLGCVLYSTSGSSGLRFHGCTICDLCNKLVVKGQLYRMIFSFRVQLQWCIVCGSRSVHEI